MNDTDVATVEVTVPANERQFGLFRYANKTECRVRNLTYRGDWPKTLPPIEAQELASPAEGPFAISRSRTRCLTKGWINRSINSSHKGIATLGPPDRLLAKDGGLHLSMHDSDGYPTWPGLIRRAKVDGDLASDRGLQRLGIVTCQGGLGTWCRIDGDVCRSRKYACGVQLVPEQGCATGVQDPTSSQDAHRSTIRRTTRW